MTTVNDELKLAQIAYQGYGDSVGWKNYQGNPMPTWDQLGDNIQAGWTAAAKAVVDYLIKVLATETPPPETEPQTPPADNTTPRPRKA